MTFISHQQQSDLQRVLPVWFNANELIWTAYSYRRNGINNGYAQPFDTAFQSLTNLHPTDFFHGAKIGLNPANPASTYRRHENCLFRRNILIEIDDGLHTPEQQLELVKSSGMPFSTAVWSGGKSVHFVIALTHSLDEATYKDLHMRIVVALREFVRVDPATNMPALYTRAPIGLRSMVVVPSAIKNSGLEKFYRAKIQEWIERGHLDLDHLLSIAEWTKPINEPEGITEEDASFIVNSIRVFLAEKTVDNKEVAASFTRIDTQRLMYCGNRVEVHHLTNWLYSTTNMRKWYASPEYDKRMGRNKPKLVSESNHKDWLYNLVIRYADDQLERTLDAIDHQYHIACPACRQDGHDSGGNHLAVLIREDLKTLIHCHKGCDTEEVIAALKER